jgi:hypothetical protein
MKKIILFLLFAAGLVSCHSNFTMDEDGKGNKYKKVSVKSPFSDMQLEVSGLITFNADETAITGISPNGYIKYYDSGRELEIKDNLAMTLYNNEKELTADSKEGKDLIADAIEETIKLQEKYK